MADQYSGNFVVDLMKDVDQSFRPLARSLVCLFQFESLPEPAPPLVRAILVGINWLGVIALRLQH